MISIKHKINSLFLILAMGFLAACSTSPLQEDSPVTPQEKIPDNFWKDIGKQSVLSDPNDLSRFQSVESTITFQGNVIEGDCARLESILTTIHTTLVVNSQGGSVSEAICMNDLLTKNGVTKVVVKGVCWSSCANYFFLGHKEKVIERGVVGFHGNATALATEANILNIFKRYQLVSFLSAPEIKLFRDFIKSKEVKPTLTKEEKDALLNFSKSIQQEHTFMVNHNIPQALFDITQRPDKGEENGKDYIFMVPSSNYLKRYGIEIQGEQDSDFVKMFNEKQTAQLLYKE